MAGSVLITAPASEPLEVAELKAHSRVTSNAEDALCADQIKAAREWCEAYSNRCFITQEWDIYLDYGFGDGCITLPLSPVQSITSIKYVASNADGMTLTTLANTEYQVSKSDVVGKIFPAYEKVWPTTKPVPDAVVIRGLFGFTELPKNLKQAVYLLAAHFYQNREGIIVGSGMDAKEVPLGIKSLLMNRKVFKV